MPEEIFTLLTASTLTAGCGMSVLVDRDRKPIVTPMDGEEKQ